MNLPPRQIMDPPGPIDALPPRGSICEPGSFGGGFLSWPLGFQRSPSRSIGAPVSKEGRSPGRRRSNRPIGG